MITPKHIKVAPPPTFPDCQKSQRKCGFPFHVLEEEKNDKLQAKRGGTRELKRKFRVVDRDVSKSMTEREESRVLECFYNLWEKKKD